MLAKYARPEDQYRVRFSNEVHFSFRPQGRIYILQKPGERVCPNYIQEQDQRVKNIQKRKKDKEEGGGEPNLGYKLYAQAAVGYNFKSELVFYNAGNSNGKINYKTYKDQILEPIVLPQLKRGDNFVLKEDGDSGHGYDTASNLVKRWKETKGLKSYKNYAGSPNFSTIKNGWQVPKQHVRKHVYLDINVLRELATKCWPKLSQDTINKWVDEMPQKLQDCIDADGRITGY